GTTRPRWRARAGLGASPNPGPRCRRPSTVTILLSATCERPRLVQPAPTRPPSGQKLSTRASTGVEIVQQWCTSRPGGAVTHRGSAPGRPPPGEARNVAPASLCDKGLRGFPQTALRIARFLPGVVHLAVSASRAVPDLGP